MLIEFEVAREWAVLATNENPQPSVIAHVFSMQGYVTATGRWTMIDGGEALLPGTVAIECSEEQRRRIEVSIAVHDKYIPAPAIDTFEAKFASEAVTYENDDPNCARYSVRIYRKLKKTFAVRERKEKPSKS